VDPCVAGTADMETVVDGAHPSVGATQDMMHMRSRILTVSGAGFALST